MKNQEGYQKLADSLICPRCGKTYKKRLPLTCWNCGMCLKCILWEKNKEIKARMNFRSTKDMSP